MKNDKFVKTILVLAALLIVCSLSVPAFAETGRNTAGEASEVTAKQEEPSEKTEGEETAAAETADADAAAEENEEKTAEDENEEPSKHHKCRKPSAPKSETEKENKPGEGRHGRHDLRSDDEKMMEGTAEEEKIGSHKHRSFGKDFDDDDFDDDDDDVYEKDHGSKKSIGRNKRNSSEQRPERSGDSSGKSREHDYGRHQRSSSERPFPPASEKISGDDKCPGKTMNESETVETETSETETAAPETVIEETPEIEAETPEGERVKDEA